MMLNVFVNGTKLDIVVSVQKSGFTWALDRGNGTLIWSTEAGPGGSAGGLTWGAAVDERSVYTNIANSDHENFTLKPSAKNTTAGGWVAMDAETGKILWSTADPANATASGPVKMANGVLFGGALVYGGMSVSDGCIYVGNGSPSVATGTSLFAVCLD
ncbi:hypothetical protein SLA2020_098380 [Shorea laevis]